ncbi:hydantoinase [Thozetella sp. PMI_491]|nr:hydantoinase [Thozetella sp. PMI_491]
MGAGIRISIDRGGTFTDVHATVPGREDIILKVLSVDPGNYNDAPTEGVRRVLEIANGQSYPRNQPLDLSQIERLRMGTTVGTNALLERKGARTALLITKGFKDLLRIGNQSRPRIFDLTVAKPELLYQSVVEIIRILKVPNLVEVRDCLQQLWAEGYRSLSIVFLHSYLYPNHERAVGDVARDMGFHVVESSALQPMIKAVLRGTSATADAYLSPIVKDYIDSISANFEGGLGATSCRCEFMQSDGGLVDFRGFGGLKSILSGPAGGVVGYAQTTWDAEEKKPVIGFDMGGTSTDCSRFSGTYEHTFESTTAGVTIQSPQLDINTVAAGGGSMLFWRDGLFVVGPESAGAHPGPACYRKGGPLTVTDANLFLGRIRPEYFPKIFGPNEDQPLGFEISAEKFHILTAKINADNKAQGLAELTAEQVAVGFLRVADECMARPIRALTESRGFSASSHILACFGGAGGQHACSLAATLGISRVVVHKFSSILSAYGLSLADVVHEAQRPAAILYSVETEEQVRRAFFELSQETTNRLMEQGIDCQKITHETYLNMRYEGSTTSLMVLGDGLAEGKLDFQVHFAAKHTREFGFGFPGKRIIVDDIRVRAIGSTGSKTGLSPYQQAKSIPAVAEILKAKDAAAVSFDEAGPVETPLYLLGDLRRGSKVPGPAIILDKTLTILVHPSSTATVLDTCVVIDLEENSELRAEPQNTPASQLSVNPVQLSIFGHRFMSIAEQMGRTLQKTAVSTNIKERLDFSCAIFSPDGGLVANAPHVPVHLGSMQFAVKYQHNHWKGRLQEGDVLISNHPACGGTHLPDITVITPVFDMGEVVFYVASRGHHADIGGILPGSMPPNSKRLWEEGAAIQAEKLVSRGVFDEALIKRLLFDEPAKYPGSSGSRCLKDNMSDLQAQVAANNQGINLIQSLIAESGLKTVHMYMYAIQDTAERAIRELLKGMHMKNGGTPLHAVDYMDDGSRIELTISINGDSGTAVFDFAGTGPEVYSNTNAPVAITNSAIIYCLRSLVASDMPLNQGCLAPIEIRVPKGSILSPSPQASVVGGNVQTSQRITDVVLKAFGACADSQGCMNNLTFGTGGKGENGHVEGFGYYETIGGGAGAGPSWDGQSGVHTHMTNTRITDPEVLEKRYPCILREFSIRQRSGGSGLHPGGDGIVRDIEFTEPVQVSILSERRTRAPQGASGGGEGEMGINLWVQRNRETGEETQISLGGKATAGFGVGDRIIIKTPGGGGWGTPQAAE